MKKALLLLMMGFMIASCGEKKDPMAETEAKNLAAFKGFDEAMQKGDMASLDKYIDANYIAHCTMPGQKPGLEGMKEGYAMMKASFPDTKWTYTNTWANGDYVIGHFQMSGTMTGPMGPMPATNKKYDVTGVDILKYKDGKAVEHWMYMEDRKMMEQMGWLPPMGAPPAADTAKPATAPEAKK
jgi:predicted SnoaL-like aldol condensation-catalyzing enzyme